MTRQSGDPRTADRDRHWSFWPATVLAGCVVVIVLVIAAYALRGTDDDARSGAEVTPCAEAVASLGSLIPDGGLPGVNLGSIKSAAVDTSSLCEAAGVPSYCRTAARAAWNRADAARTDSRRAQALANFRRTQPLCLQELTGPSDRAAQQATVSQSRDHGRGLHP